jgi:hypothetical protein
MSARTGWALGCAVMILGMAGEADSAGSNVATGRIHGVITAVEKPVKNQPWLRKIRVKSSSDEGFVLIMPTTVILRRVGKRLDKLAAEDLDVHSRVEVGYRKPVNAEKPWVGQGISVFIQTGAK